VADFEDQTAAEVAGIQRRRVITLVVMILAILLIPFGCVVPCGIGLAFKQNETVYNIFMVAGILLPLVGLTTMILMFLDRSRYARAWGIAQFAVENNYAYSYHPRLDRYEFLQSLQIFASANGSSADNWVHGKYKKFSFTFVDFSYLVGFGRYQANYTQTVLVLHDAAAGSPIFVLYPKGWTDRLAKMLGGRSIAIPGAKKFNSTFILSGVREDKIIDRFTTGDMIDDCLDEPSLSMEVNSEDLILFRDSKLLSPGRYEDFLDTAIKMATVLRGEA
jgi:hypothetical protein